MLVLFCVVCVSAFLLSYCQSIVHFCLIIHVSLFYFFSPLLSVYLPLLSPRASLPGEYRDMARLMRIGSSDHAELLFAILPTLPGFDHTIIEEEEDFQEYDSSGDDELEAAEFLASALRVHPAVFNEVVAEAVAAGEFDEPDDDDEDE